MCRTSHRREKKRENIYNMEIGEREATVVVAVSKKIK